MVLVALSSTIACLLLFIILGWILGPKSRYDLSPEAIKLGSPLGSTFELYYTDFESDTYCGPRLNSLDQSSLTMARWLDSVAGVCTSGMEPLEIRERVIEILDLRTSVIESDLLQLPPEDLALFAVYSTPQFPNSLGRNPFRDEILVNKSDVSGRWWTALPFIRRRSWVKRFGNAIDLNNRNWVYYERLHRIIPYNAIDTLSVFEFKLLLSTNYIKHEYKFWEQAPYILQLGLPFIGLTSRAAAYKIYTHEWIVGMKGLEKKLKKAINMATEKDMQLVDKYLTSMNGNASAVLVSETRTYLSVYTPYLPYKAVANPGVDEAISKNVPLPRAAWSTEHIASFPMWFGNEPPPIERSASLEAPALAIVIPFHDRELPKLQQFLKFWPSDTNESKVKVPVVMALNTDFDTEGGRVLAESLRQMWKSAGAYDSIPLYFLSLRQPATNHYDGAAISFYQVLGYLGPYFKSVQIMETDIRPLQSKWMAHLAHEAKGACTDWWVKGSSQLCSPVFNMRFDRRGDFHINGNAMYAVGCKSFRHYLRRVQAFYPPSGILGGQCHVMGGCETTKPLEGGYDHVLFGYRKELSNFHYSRYIQQLFTYTPAILNLCEDEYSIDEILSRHPNAAIVHSKFHQFSPEEQILLRVYKKVLLGSPSDAERKLYWPRIRYGTLDEVTLLKELCQKSIAEKNMTKFFDLTGYSNSPFTLHDRRQEIPYHLKSSCSNMQHHQRSGMRGSKSISEIMSVRVEYNNLEVLACIMPILSKHGAVIRFSTNTTICDTYGDCRHSSHDQDFQKIDLGLCGESLSNCENSLGEIPLIVYLTSAGIMRDIKEYGTDGWIQRLRHVSKTFKTVIVAADHATFLKLKSLELGTQPFLAEQWCYDIHNDIAIRDGKRTAVIAPKYAPSVHEVLLWSPNANDTLPYLEQVTSDFKSELITDIARVVTVIDVNDRYPKRPAVEDLIRHPAIIVLPTGPISETTEIISIYRLGIPMFVPATSLIRSMYNINDATGLPWPGIQTFTSKADLISQLQNPKLFEHTKTITEHNQHVRSELDTNWTAILSTAMNI